MIIDELTKYQHKSFNEEKNSIHRVTVLVGNGFDISLLQHLHAKRSTTYESFYFHLKSVKFNHGNILFQKMEELRQKHEKDVEDGGDGYPNWCDFEHILDSLKNSSKSKPSLEDALAELQLEFSEYLNGVVTPSILSETDTISKEYGHAYRSFGRFLADLSPENYKKLDWSEEFNHYDIFSFNIINFNYTSLLDNYLYLDKTQFDPKPHKGTDTNFWFRINPRDYDHKRKNFGPNCETGCSAYLTTALHHPHGHQHTPRSLLFGIDGDDDAAEKGSGSRLEKTFWAQTPRKYQRMILDTTVFILFGCSLGETDGWWWRHILERVSTGAKLIIYKYDRSLHSDDSQSENEIIEEFITSYTDGSTAREIRKMKKRIALVRYSDSTSLSFLGFSDIKYDPSDRDPNIDLVT